MPLPVFVLGMRRFPRYKKVLKELKETGIDAQIVYGVDLMGGDVLAPDEKVNRYQIIFKTGMPTYGSVGCYFAHYRLFKHILSLNIERAIVLECDVSLGPHFKDILEQLEQLDMGYELVQLFTADNVTPRLSQADKIPLVHEHFLHRPLGHLFGTVSYMITRGALKKLLPKLNLMTAPIDYVFGAPQITGLRTYLVYPSVISSPNSWRKSSLIKSELSERYQPGNSPIRYALENVALRYSKLFKPLGALIAKFVKQRTSI